MTGFKVFVLVLFILLAASLPVFAKERVAVIDFEAKDVEESDAMAITDFFRSDLVAAGNYIVLERGNMQSILAEHELTMSGLTNEATTSEIGELLAVNYLFLGNLSKFGNKYLLVIDKINVSTGEIENSIKKNALNMDEFIELSAEAAAELSGDTSLAAASAESAGYDAATLTEFIEQISILHLTDISTLDVDMQTMQASDLQLRRDIYAEYELDNAVVSMLVNVVTFGIAGNFIQGFDELGWASVGTTAAFGLSFLTQSTALKIVTGILYASTYTAGIVSPFIYEANYNQYMKDTLLSY